MMITTAFVLYKHNILFPVPRSVPSRIPQTLRRLCTTPFQIIVSRTADILLLCPKRSDSKQSTGASYPLPASTDSHALRTADLFHNAEQSHFGQLPPNQPHRHRKARRRIKNLPLGLDSELAANTAYFSCGTYPDVRRFTGLA